MQKYDFFLIYRVFFVFLQLTMDEVGHELIEVEACVSAIDAVVFVGIDAELKLFACVLESRDHIDCILEMDVVVTSAVDEQIIALKQIGEVEGGVVVVAAGVVLRALEESLGVDVVVVTPRDDGCDGDGRFEHVVTFEDGECGQIATKAPAKDSDSGFVNPLFLAEPAGCSHSILAFHATQVFIGHFLEVGTASTGAASVETGHDVALLCQHVKPVVVAVAIAIGHLLVAGTAIDIEEERVFLGAVEVGRQDDVVVQVGAKLGGEGAEGRHCPARS